MKNKEEGREEFYQGAEFFFNNMGIFLKYLEKPENSQEVQDILCELDSDLIIDGENRYREAYNKLLALGENTIAEKFIIDLTK